MNYYIISPARGFGKSTARKLAIILCSWCGLLPMQTHGVVVQKIRD